MGIIAINVNTTGLVGQTVQPRRCTMVTTDNLAKITTPGYLNNQNYSGNSLLPTDIFDVLYSFNEKTEVGIYGIFQLTYSSSTGFTLVLWGNPGDVLLPVVNNDFANFNGTTGQIKDAGYLPSNPALQRVVMQSGASVIGDLPKYNDVTGTLIDSGITAAAVAALISGGSGGAGVHSATSSGSFPTASTVITDPAITAASVVIARFKSSANVVTIRTVLPANGSFTVVTDTAPSTGVLEYISYIPSAALVTAGIVAGKFSGSSGPATFVITDPNITSGMVINANFQSQGTPSEIYTAIAGNGTITFVVTSGPGVYVMEYVGMLPGSIPSFGLEAVNYSYAGGFASIVISDAAITSSSIVTAEFKSQSVVALIQKVTPSAGTLTILASIDPGPSVLAYQATSSATGGTALQANNNLSDVASPSASLANIGGLPLAGGQMTGQLLLDRGTATSTAGAATINNQAGVITTEALTTASGAAYAFVLTNSRILTSSIVICSLLGGTNTKHGLSFTCVPSNGSCAISILNNDISAAALNGTLIFGFEVI